MNRRVVVVVSTRMTWLVSKIVSVGALSMGMPVGAPEPSLGSMANLKLNLDTMSLIWVYTCTVQWNSALGNVLLGHRMCFTNSSLSKYAHYRSVPHHNNIMSLTLLTCDKGADELDVTAAVSGTVTRRVAETAATGGGNLAEVGLATWSHAGSRTACMESSC